MVCESRSPWVTASQLKTFKILPTLYSDLLRLCTYSHPRVTSITQFIPLHIHEEHEFYLPPTPPSIILANHQKCPQHPTSASPAAPMHHIGAKIEIPAHHNIKGWELFYHFITRLWNTWEHLNYCKEIDPARAEENQHWNNCKIRKGEEEAVVRTVWRGWEEDSWFRQSVCAVERGCLLIHK